MAQLVFHNTDNLDEKVLTSIQPSSKISRPKDQLAVDKLNQSKEGLIFALAPPSVLHFEYRAAWILPNDARKRGVTILHLVPGNALEMLERLTSCSMVMSNDEIIMYIGAESEQNVALAEHKLSTIAKFAVSYFIRYYGKVLNLIHARRCRLDLMRATSILFTPRKSSRP